DGPGPQGEATRVVPPLLRRAVRVSQPADGDHVLVYLLHDGFADALARWHATRPETRVEVFWGRSGAPERVELRPNLVCRRISDDGFLDALRSCRALVTTAGFQAVAEARWLGKPVMVIPTPGHVEQRWNAQETARSGSGIVAEGFDLDPLLA